MCVWGGGHVFVDTRSPTATLHLILVTKRPRHIGLTGKTWHDVRHVSEEILTENFSCFLSCEYLMFDLRNSTLICLVIDNCLFSRLLYVITLCVFCSCDVFGTFSQVSYKPCFWSVRARSTMWDASAVCDSVCVWLYGNCSIFFSVMWTLLVLCHVWHGDTDELQLDLVEKDILIGQLRTQLKQLRARISEMEDDAAVDTAPLEGLLTQLGEFKVRVT